MASLPPLGEQPEIRQLLSLPANTHYEPATPIDSTLTPPSTNTSHTTDANPFDIKPDQNSEQETFQHNSDDDVQYAPIRAGVDSDQTTLERTASKKLGGLNEEERSELKRIASSLQQSRTCQSRDGSYLQRRDTLASVTEDDPRLDPSQPEFNIYIWARAFMRSMDEDDIKAARSGFTFKSLNVSGTGSAVSLQQNVASILMAPLRLKEYVSFGKKSEKKILRDFNGVVKNGEMLVVLGRPGSGCSTFLKTICGELSGLALHEDSIIHYNGMTQLNGTFQSVLTNSTRHPPEEDDQRI